MSGSVGGFIDRPSADGICRSGAEGSWKRVRLNKKTPPKESVCVSMFVQVGFDMVSFHKIGRDSQHQSDGNGSILKTWVTDLSRDVLRSNRGSELCQASCIGTQGSFSQLGVG